MKIVHFVNRLGFGGIEKLVIDICNTIPSEHKVIIAVKNKISNEWKLLNGLRDTVSLHSFNKRSKIKLFFDIFVFLKKEAPDIVNIHSTFLNYLAPFSFLFRKTKFVYTIHNEARFIEPSQVLLKAFRRYCFKKRRVFPVAIADINRIDFEKYYKFSGITHTIYNGTTPPKQMHPESVRSEIESLKFTPNSKVIISVGRLTSSKNHELLIRVFNRLFDERHDFIVIVIGDDLEADQRVIKRFKSLASRAIHFIGSRENVGDYMKNADCFLLSSHHEGCPITILEAFSMGLPVLSTPVGSIPDLVKDLDNGILSDSIDEQDFYSAALRFFSLSKEQVEMIKSNNLIRYREKFSIEMVSKLYIEHYRLLQEKNVDPRTI